MPTDDSKSPRPALPSVRGIVLGENRQGLAIDQTTLRQWLRLSAEKFKAQKVDLYLPEATTAKVLPLLDEADHLGIRLSLRTTEATSPDIVAALAEAGLLDVALEPSEFCADTLAPWVDATASASLPLRVFLRAEQLSTTPDNALVALAARATSVSIALDDDMTYDRPPNRLPETTLENIAQFVSALREHGTEVLCRQIPFCRFPAPLWPAIAQGPQLLAHHQHYRTSALEFVKQVKNLAPTRIHQAVEISLGKGTSFHSRIDDAVLPWVLEHPWYFFWLWFLHKLTRRLPLRRPEPEAMPEGLTELEALLASYQKEQRRTLGPICANCRLHPICDHHTEVFKQVFPSLGVEAIEGSIEYDPRAFFDPESAWYDAVDNARRREDADLQSQLALVQQRLATEAPTREIPAESYEIQDHATHHMPASVRWFSFSTAALQSTALARLSPPFTLSVTVGGGIAELMGFALGRHTRLMCPMTAFDHKLTLDVRADGRYLLLRDGKPVNPVAYADGDQVPERIGSVAEPRIAFANIDGQIVTQTVLLWEASDDTERVGECTHSVVVVCTRYARRLQAALLSLAHQTGLEPGALEVIVGYVPGVDATEDVLDSIEGHHPDIRLIRAPFARQHTRAKGFIINECIALAQGAWITLLDADIMLPPTYFDQLESAPQAAMLVAPDGRYMLSRDATASVLLGATRPWEDYEAALKLDGEYRYHESDGVPPGFCQSVRRAVFEDIAYQELDHFEGSDWWFSAQVIEKYGKETRLEGMRVLHLDHGGSQWYGTDKQF